MNYLLNRLICCSKMILCHKTCNTFNIENYYAIFPTSDFNSIFPFDIFAASFFLLTRYEEYLIFDRDNHDRFIPEASIAYKLSFLEEPVINQWSLKLTGIIKNKYPEFEFIENEFEFISTIDIDRAYEYELERPLKIIRSMIGALIKFRLCLCVKIFLIRLGLIKDPLDTFSWLDWISQQYKINMIYFVLVGSCHKYDINNPPKNIIFQHLIQKLNTSYKLGIHPSYESNSNEEILKSEIDQLEKILCKKIEASRQHFLKLNLPDTYEKLLNCGIKEDYSMGYSTRLGFRASICTGYYWYNLDKNIETNLKIYPFAYMDGTFVYSLKYTQREAIKKHIDLLEKVKQVKGTFISIWHNSSLSGIGIWAGWDYVYHEMVVNAKKYC